MRELRTDGQGRLDDIAISGARLVRIERMRPDVWWIRLYLRDPPDIVLWVSAKDGEILVEESEP